ncbi:hypothetical protein SASPL_147530 [Salvia splendens]|uniref:Cell division cycle protein 123 n=1 Tax=Salvia splendens TaxID=180675 RepID=A0A8X8WE78_SALSN|nr:hypothetical protein SASPL_147530 [Salvia splendens]
MMPFPIDSTNPRKRKILLCPRDPETKHAAPFTAAWMSSTGSLRCTNFSEIALLLRSSDSVVHDLFHAYDSCTDKTASRPSRFYLALWKWYPSLHDKALVGICQRELSRSVLGFSTAMGSQSNNEDMVPQQALDVYVAKDGRVKVLDFNPWGASRFPCFTLGRSWKSCRARKWSWGFEGIGWDQFLRNADVELRKQTTHPSLSKAGG